MLLLYVISTENTKFKISEICFALLCYDYLISDLAFQKHLINFWSTLGTFNRRWINVFMQPSFNVLLLTLDKLSKVTFQKRSHDVKANVEATFLKHFCADRVAPDRNKILKYCWIPRLRKNRYIFSITITFYKVY